MGTIECTDRIQIQAQKTVNKFGKLIAGHLDLVSDLLDNSMGLIRAIGQGVFLSKGGLSNDYGEIRVGSLDMVSDGVLSNMGGVIESQTLDRLIARKFELGNFVVGEIPRIGSIEVAAGSLIIRSSDDLKLAGRLRATGAIICHTSGDFQSSENFEATANEAITLECIGSAGSIDLQAGQISGRALRCQAPNGDVQFRDLSCRAVLFIRANKQVTLGASNGAHALAQVGQPGRERGDARVAVLDRPALLGIVQRLLDEALTRSIVEAQADALQALSDFGDLQKLQNAHLMSPAQRLEFEPGGGDERPRAQKALDLPSWRPAPRYMATGCTQPHSQRIQCMGEVWERRLELAGSRHRQAGTWGPSTGSRCQP